MHAFLRIILPLLVWIFATPLLANNSNTERKTLVEKHNVKKRIGKTTYVPGNLYYMYLDLEELKATQDSNGYAVLSILISKQKSLAGFIRLNSDGYDSERIHAAAKTKANLMIGNTQTIALAGQKQFDELGRRYINYYEGKNTKLQTYLPKEIFQFAIYEGADEDDLELVRKTVGNQQIPFENIDRKNFPYLSDIAFNKHFAAILAEREMEKERLQTQIDKNLAAGNVMIPKKTYKTSKFNFEEQSSPQTQSNVLENQKLRVTLFFLGSSVVVLGALATLDHFNIPTRVVNMGNPAFSRLIQFKKATMERALPMIQRHLPERFKSNKKPHIQSHDLLLPQSKTAIIQPTTMIK